MIQVNIFSLKNNNEVLKFDSFSKENCYVTDEIHKNINRTFFIHSTNTHLTLTIDGSFTKNVNSTSISKYFNTKDKFTQRKNCYFITR